MSRSVAESARLFGCRLTAREKVIISGVDLLKIEGGKKTYIMLDETKITWSVFKQLGGIKEELKDKLSYYDLIYWL